uniref:Macaca fascicularis brain cDNA clone: QtrA-15139, similar to human KIAA0406 gene product (KIAA0406), mRNA, RefSeq: NM_014657.1 n=1 Tax=Macaca fascicularis TaxID=9541 RepID=I7GNE3_MACFA|nr:unnamed protein product [Macaca fascicularis]
MPHICPFFNMCERTRTSPGTLFRTLCLSVFTQLPKACGCV